MSKLNLKNVSQLLKLIKHTEDRKTVKKFLQDLDRYGSDQSEENRAKKIKRSAAKKALEIIARTGFEIGKHKLIESFLDFFD